MSKTRKVLVVETRLAIVDYGKYGLCDLAAGEMQQDARESAHYDRAAGFAAWHDGCLTGWRRVVATWVLNRLCC